MKNKAQQVTLCKFHPGYGVKFMYFISLDILYFVDYYSLRIRAENLLLPVVGNCRCFIKWLSVNKKAKIFSFEFQ